MNFKNSFVARSMQIAGMTLCLAAISIPACAQAPSPADWTQFHRDNMQRWNPYETALGVSNATQLQLKWKSPVNNSQGGTSSPAVVGGVVYIGSDDGNIYALNASTGVKLWSYATASSSPVTSSPAVANGIVYVGSADGNVYALNASTGTAVWSYSTGGAVTSAPTVVNGVVYFGSADGFAYALNANTGSHLWTHGTCSTSCTISSPVVVNGIIYIGSSDGNVSAVNANTGGGIWRTSSGGINPSSPAAANGAIYLGSGNSVIALNASGLVRLWTFTINPPFSVRSSPAVANGAVYVGCDDGNVYALNASTGVKLWSFPAGSAVDSSPAVANGVVYVGSELGALFALNASTGAKLWSYATGGPANSSPAVTNGVVYIRAGDPSGGDAYAFAALAPGNADLNLRATASEMTVHQGDLLTFTFPVWNMGPGNAVFEVLNTQIPAGTIFDYVRISGTPGLGTCTTPPYQGTGQIICQENASMAQNTTWTVRLTVKVTAVAGTAITENAATMSDTPDPNMANNTATVSVTMQ